jgi:hypothetical protein
MNTKIVSAVVDMKLAGEFKHFEIRIPDNIKSIDGIETSVRIQSDIFEMVKPPQEKMLQGSTIIGELRLNGGKDNNWFYAHTINECLIINQWKLSRFELNNLAFQPINFNKKKDGDNIAVLPKGTRLKGYIKDVLGQSLQTNINYSITICIHLSTN